MSEIRQTFSDWGHMLIDLVERVYRMVRGLPHNRNATIVVIVGCAILAGPFWEPYLRAWFEKLAGVHVDLPTEPIYGVLLIVLGFGYHIAMTWLAMCEGEANATRRMQAEERIRAHDAPIFEKLIGEAPENKFTGAMNCLRNDHAWSNDQSVMVINAYYFLDTVSNEFNDRGVQAKADALKAALAELTNFTSHHFFVIDAKIRGQLRYALEPDLTWDRGGSPTPEQERCYRELDEKLLKLADNVTEAYTDLLRTGQQRLL